MRFHQEVVRPDLERVISEAFERNLGPLRDELRLRHRMEERWKERRISLIEQIDSDAAQL